MTDELRIDMMALDQLWRDLCLVESTFGDIESAAHVVASAVGHPRLAGVVNHFESDWDEKRRGIVDSLDALWKQARAVHDAFVQVDADLAKPLR